MNKILKMSGSSLVKNTLINFVGQFMPMLVAVITIPFIIKGLGIERFGILSLAWAVLGYFNLFDFGVGRATTKFVSEALWNNDAKRIPKIVWASLTIQVVMSFLGSISLALITPFLVENILKIPLHLIKQTKIVFYLLSLTVPLIVLSKNLRSVFEAGQRFDLINAIQIPSGSLIFLLPVIGILAHFQLNGIIMLLVILCIMNTLAYLFMFFNIFPEFGKNFCLEKGMFTSLLTFGGWTTLSNIIVPVLVYSDRFLISAIVSVKALTYYTVPYEIISRLMIFPSVLCLTLFPAFSALSKANKEDVAHIYARSLKYIIVIMGPIVVISIIFSNEILLLWLGKDFALKSSLVFQVLAVGMLLNALAQMPANLLDGIGRPDLKAKILLSYVFVYICLAWLLITKMAIIGAALAWAIRGALEFGLFFIISWKLLRFRPTIFIEGGFLRGLAVFIIFVAVTVATTLLVERNIWSYITITVLYLVSFGLLIWRYALDQMDRNKIKVLFFNRIYNES